MLNAKCDGCQASVWLAVNERDGKIEERYYSEIEVYRLVTHNGGKPKAVRVRGVYQKHNCGKMNLVIRPTERMTRKGQTGVIPAKVVRARRRRKFVLSGRP